jgi:hypothetical protein
MLENILNFIKTALRSFISFVKRLATKIIHGLLNFKAHVVSWFKGRSLVKGTHIPTVIKGKTLRDLLETAPVHKLDEDIFSKNNTVAQAVYDKETDEITDLQILGADELDSETQSIFNQYSNNDIIVLN